MHGLDAANARADIGPDAVAILFVKVKPRILKCHSRRHNRKLRIAIHALCLFLVDIAVDAEVLDLARNLCSVVRRIESSDALDPILSCEQRLPESLFANADRRDRANPRNDNSLLQTNRLLS